MSTERDFAPRLDLETRYEKVLRLIQPWLVPVGFVWFAALLAYSAFRAFLEKGGHSVIW